ncbi:hypothetical protein WA158_007582 [Blastocystis sp. Blastoise]
MEWDDIDENEIKTQKNDPKFDLSSLLEKIQQNALNISSSTENVDSTTNMYFLDEAKMEYLWIPTEISIDENEEKENGYIFTEPSSNLDSLMQPVLIPFDNFVSRNRESDDKNNEISDEDCLSLSKEDEEQIIQWLISTESISSTLYIKLEKQSVSFWNSLYTQNECLYNYSLLISLVIYTIKYIYISYYFLYFNYLSNIKSILQKCQFYNYVDYFFNFFFPILMDHNFKTISKENSLLIQFLMEILRIIKNSCSSYSLNDNLWNKLYNRWNSWKYKYTLCTLLKNISKTL